LRRQLVIRRDLNKETNFNSVAGLPYERIAAITCERFAFVNTSATEKFNYLPPNPPAGGSSRRKSASVMTAW